jgi:hypothetical protein
MSAINFPKTYPLPEIYEITKERATRVLGKYADDPTLYSFNSADKSVTFTTERLIPTVATHRPRVMILCSNPHPHSVRQGMFLSPTTRGRESLFWVSMRDAAWIPTADTNLTPTQLLDLCLHAKYQGPFEFIFYCYYAFPTDYPEDIARIFGKGVFQPGD